MLKLSSLKLSSSALISSSTVDHSSGFQRDACGSGEGWISSPTDQNFGGAPLDILFCWQNWLGREIYLRVYYLRRLAGGGISDIIVIMWQTTPEMIKASGPISLLSAHLYRLTRTTCLVVRVRRK